jgi:cytidylate kinase
MSPVQIITISGLAGSGTTTVCDRLGARLGWAYVNAGTVFRQLAQEAGLSLAEFGQRAEADGHIDRQLDARLVAQAQACAPVVVEGRLTGWMAQRHQLPALKVWLQAVLAVRAERVGQREGKPLAQAIAETRQREASEAQRYAAHHQISISDLSVYDLVVDTERRDAQAACAHILAHLGRP